MAIEDDLSDLGGMSRSEYYERLIHKIMRNPELAGLVGLNTNGSQSNYFDASGYTPMVFTPPPAGLGNFTVDLTSLMRRRNAPGRTALILIAYSLIIIVSLFGNLLVCHVFARTRRLHTVTNTFLANLALSDLVMTALNIPFNLARVLLEDWPFGGAMCSLVPFVQVTSVYVSAFTMVAIALDRYQVIVHPLKPRMGAFHGAVVIAVIWLLAAMASLPYAIYNEVVEVFTYRTLSRCQPRYPPPALEFRRWLTLATFLTQYVLPLGITGVAYTCVTRRVWWRAVVGATTEEQLSLQLRAKKKTVKMLVVVVLLFALCWLPLNMYHLVVDLSSSVGPSRHSSTIFFLCHWLAMSNVCCNPFIYCWLNDNFREGAMACLWWLAKRTCHVHSGGNEPTFPQFSRPRDSLSLSSSALTRPGGSLRRKFHGNSLRAVHREEVHVSLDELQIPSSGGQHSTPEVPRPSPTACSASCKNFDSKNGDKGGHAKSDPDIVFPHRAFGAVKRCSHGQEDPVELTRVDVDSPPASSPHRRLQHPTHVQVLRVHERKPENRDKRVKNQEGVLTENVADETEIFPGELESCIGTILRPIPEESHKSSSGSSTPSGDCDSLSLPSSQALSSSDHLDLKTLNCHAAAIPQAHCVNTIPGHLENTSPGHHKLIPPVGSSPDSKCDLLKTKRGDHWHLPATPDILITVTTDYPVNIPSKQTVTTPDISIVRSPDHPIGTTIYSHVTEAPGLVTLTPGQFETATLGHLVMAAPFANERVRKVSAAGLIWKTDSEPSLMLAQDISNTNKKLLRRGSYELSMRNNENSSKLKCEKLAKITNESSSSPKKKELFSINSPNNLNPVIFNSMGNSKHSILKSSQESNMKISSLHKASVHLLRAFRDTFASTFGQRVLSYPFFQRGSHNLPSDQEVTKELQLLEITSNIRSSVPKDLISSTPGTQSLENQVQVISLDDPEESEHEHENLRSSQETLHANANDYSSDLEPGEGKEAKSQTSFHANRNIRKADENRNQQQDTSLSFKNSLPSLTDLDSSVSEESLQAKERPINGEEKISGKEILFSPSPLPPPLPPPPLRTRYMESNAYNSNCQGLLPHHQINELERDVKLPSKKHLTLPDSRSPSLNSVHSITLSNRFPSSLSPVHTSVGLSKKNLLGNPKNSGSPSTKMSQATWSSRRSSTKNASSKGRASIQSSEVVRKTNQIFPSRVPCSRLPPPTLTFPPPPSRSPSSSPSPLSSSPAFRQELASRTHINSSDSCPSTSCVSSSFSSYPLEVSSNSSPSPITRSSPSPVSSPSSNSRSRSPDLSTSLFPPNCPLCPISNSSPPRTFKNPFPLQRPDNSPSLRPFNDFHDSSSTLSVLSSSKCMSTCNHHGLPRNLDGCQEITSVTCNCDATVSSGAEVTHGISVGTSSISSVQQTEQVCRSDYVYKKTGYPNG